MLKSLSTRIDRQRRYFLGGPGLFAIVAIVLQGISFLGIPLAWIFSLMAFGVMLLMLGNSTMSLHDRTYGRIEQADQRTDQNSQQIQNHASQLQLLRNNIEDVEAKSISPKGLSANRTLQKETITRLIEEWGEILDLRLKQTEIKYYAHRVRMIEAMSVGRLATPIETILLRCLATLSINTTDQTVRLLEIGTLFGLGSSIIYDICRANSKTVELHLIDPLFGYYSEGNRDIMLNINVNSTIVRNNLALLNIPDEHIILYEGLSTDREIIASVTQQQFDIILIDGDHSLEGVKMDFEYYHSSVKNGGYILFDDYNNPAWPDIKKYVDDEIMPRNDLEFVGAGWYTAIFRKIEIATN